MTLKTGRAQGVARITVDHERCTLCGLCVTICKGGPLYVRDSRIEVDQSRFFGCTGCGHCMAVCPRDAVVIGGRDISPADLIDLPEKGIRSTYDELFSLMVSRRSVREFDGREVPRSVVDRIVEAIGTAPMGMPPSDVELLVLAGSDRVAEFSRDVIAVMRRKWWMISPIVLSAMRPIMGGDRYTFIKTFVVPLITTVLEKDNEGLDWLCYDAPLAIVFHISPLSADADTLIAATYAMLAAEALGLSSCMIGSVGPYLKFGGGKIRKKYGIPQKNRVGITVVFGYPKVRFARGIKRRLAGVRFY
jgi:ferredoxin